MCCAKHDPTALDGFPLYWTEHPKLLKAKALDELSFADRGVQGLGWPGDRFRHAEAHSVRVQRTHPVHTLSTYFGREAPLLLPLVICVLLHHACSVGLLHLFSSMLCSLCFVHLRALWICITALALTSVIWFF